MKMKSNKIIKELSRIQEHNTDIFDTDLYKLENTVSEIKETIEEMKVVSAPVAVVPVAPVPVAPVPSAPKMGVKRKAKDEIRDELIARLMNGKKKTKAWKKGMSKYGSITYMENSSKKWLWQSVIFDDGNQNFDTKDEAEAFYEKVIAKYNIPVEYITRREYDPEKDHADDEDEYDDAEYDDDEVVEEEVIEEED
jgi:hypothetical protein